MATGKLGHSKTRVPRARRLLSEFRSGGDRRAGLREVAGGALFALLVSSATVSAQEEEAPPAPVLGAPTTVLPDTRTQEDEEEAQQAEETQQEERRALPFVLPEPSLTETLMPDASPDLNTSVLFPPSALEAFPRPERALRVGQFAVSPGIEVAAAYDHINRAESESTDDVTGNLGVSVRADSLFERHSLGFGVNAAIGNPQRNVGDNVTDRIAVTSGVDGRLDLTRRSSLSAEARFARGAQSPEAQEAGAEDEPTVFRVGGAVAYTQRFNRLGWRVAGGINRREASDGEQADEQDSTRYTVSPRADYQLSRRLSVFADASYAIDRYDQSGEGGSRDSQTVRADVGTEIALGRTFSVALGVGYIGVFFEDLERTDTHQPFLTADLNGAIGIELDQLTLLRLGLNHSTDQTTAEDAALIMRTQAFASVTRSLTRAAAIVASVRLARGDFVDEDRTDHDVIAQLGYSHTLLRNIALNVGYRYSQRFSNNSEDEFSRHTVSVGLSAAF